MKNIEIEQLQESARELQERDNHQRETVLRLERNSQDFQQANEQLQQEVRELRSNIETPHWVIGREELLMTRQEIGGGAYGKVNIGVLE